MPAIDRFVPGQMVKKWAGVQMVGTVTSPIYWKDCDDSTKGYCKKVWLKHIDKEDDK